MRTRVTLSLALAAVGGLAVADPVYHLTDLGTLGGDYSSGYGLNSAPIIC